MSSSLVRGPGSPTFRVVLGVLAVFYLLAIFLGSAGSSLPQKALPRPVLYFSQIACLFPKAATHSIEYRAAAFACEAGRDLELDTRAYFPMRPDDKENRFHRVGHFHRRDPRVMQALDEFLVSEHNARVSSEEGPSDGIEGPIGGIAILSLRIPLPEPGDPVERYRPMGYLEVPSEWRKYWYRTRKTEIAARCETGAQ